MSNTAGSPRRRVSPSQAGRSRHLATTTDPEVTRAIAELDAWDEDGFRIVRASLGRLHPALKTLASRGITAAERKRLRDLVAIAEKGTSQTVPEAPLNAEEKAAHHDALIELRAPPPILPARDSIAPVRSGLDAIRARTLPTRSGASGVCAGANSVEKNGAHGSVGTIGERKRG